MKSTELRIGNHVKDPYGKEIKLVTVDKDASMLSPIPLTEEWLLKFGFKYNYFEDEDGYIISNDYVLSLGEYSELSIEDDFSFWIGSKTSDETVCFDNDIIESVHRLQNLYHALTGEEL